MGDLFRFQPSIFPQKNPGCFFCHPQALDLVSSWWLFLLSTIGFITIFHQKKMGDFFFHFYLPLRKFRRKNPRRLKRPRKLTIAHHPSPSVDREAEARKPVQVPSPPPPPRRNSGASSTTSATPSVPPPPPEPTKRKGRGKGEAWKSLRWRIWGDLVGEFLWRVFLLLFFFCSRDRMKR